MMRVVVAAIAILCLQAAAQEHPACTIGGAVVDGGSNEPVPRSRVIAEAGSYTFLRLSGEDGSFCFEHLTPGDYRVIVQKAGYGETRYPTTLAVEGSEAVKPLTLRIAREAGLSGTVLDSNGEFLPGAEVTVWQRLKDGPDEVDGATADGRGAFRVSELAPGTYYLSVAKGDEDQGRYAIPFVDSQGQMPSEREVETFYSASFTFADATPVEVKAGQQVDNLVLTLKRARLRRVSGRIANPPRTGLLYYNAETGTRSNSGVVPIASDGSFLKTGLPPARYTFRLMDGQKTIARKDVDLDMGDATGVALDPIDTIDVPVLFRTEGKGTRFLPRQGEVILFRDGSDEGTVLEATGDSIYRFSGVERGTYRLHVGLAGQNLYVKGLTYGGETQTGGKIDLRSPREGGLEITLSSNMAELQGKVTARGDESDDLTVILVDEGRDGTPIAHETGTDQKGRFRMPAVPPGKYRLFAIEGFDDDDWGSPELAKVLQAKSVELELKESDKKQVSVTVISAGEWKRQ